MENVNVIETEAPKLTKAETELKQAIDAAYAAASADDFKQAKDIANSNEVRVVTLTPTVSAILANDYNKRNRSLTISKVRDYEGAIARGEWKLNHQGIAFYPDGTIADGQHRVHAVALGSKAVDTLVFPNFDKSAIDTIDRAAKRNAGEALEMMGIADGKLKAPIAKTVMEYEFELEHGSRPRFTDPQVEKWVMENDAMMDRAMEIGESSCKNVSDACLNAAEARTMVLLMLRGGWTESMTAGYVASIQQGVATYPEAPTVYLARLYMKSKLSNKRTDTLTKKQKLALAMKGLGLWAEEKSVARLTWKQNKEPLPTNKQVVAEAA